MPRTPKPPAPCCVCAAPSTRNVGMKRACDDCAEPLHQAALDKRDAVLAELRRMAAQRAKEEGVAA